MRLVYIGDDVREVAPHGYKPFVVEPGQTFDVPDDVGESLLAQPKRFAEAKAPKKAPASTSTADTEGDS